MKIKMILLAIAIICATSISVAFANCGTCASCGTKSMCTTDSCEVKGDMMPDALGLTDDQEKSMDEINANHMKTMEPIMAKMETTKMELKKLVGAESFDEMAVRDKATAMGDLMRQMHNAMMDKCIATLKILTTEQKVKYFDMMNERMSMMMNHMGMGMKPDKDTMMKMKNDMAMKLNLTEDQKKVMDEMSEKYMMAADPINAKMEMDKADLKKLIAAEPFDEMAVKDKMTDMGNLMGQMHDAMVEKSIGIMKSLNQEQRIKYFDMMSERMNMMMGHMKMGMRMKYDMSKELGLSDDQKKAIDEINEKFMMDTKPIMDKMEIVKAESRTILGAETLDETAVKAKMAEMTNLMNQMNDPMMAKCLATIKVLTPEQRVKYFDMMNEHMKMMMSPMGMKPKPMKNSY